MEGIRFSAALPQNVFGFFIKQKYSLLLNLTHKRLPGAIIIEIVVLDCSLEGKIPSWLKEVFVLLAAGPLLHCQKGFELISSVRHSTVSVHNRLNGLKHLATELIVAFPSVMQASQTKKWPTQEKKKETPPDKYRMEIEKITYQKRLYTYGFCSSSQESLGSLVCFRLMGPFPMSDNFPRWKADNHLSRSFVILPIL